MIILIISSIILLILHLIKSTSKFYIKYELIVSAVMIGICTINFIQKFNFWYIFLIIIYFYIFYNSFKKLI